MLLSLLSLLLLICSSLYNNQSPPFSCFLLLFALKRTVCIVYITLLSIISEKVKVLNTKKVWSCLSVTKLRSVPCSAFDPSWASSALRRISRDFSLWPLARKHKLFVEGSRRNCQPDGSQLVLHQKSRLLKQTETGQRTLCISIACFWGRCHFILRYAILILCLMW